MSAQADSGEKIEGSHEPRECMACRGTGRVISNLGGSQNAVECPWCGGRGMRIPGHDAQAHFAAGEPDAGAAGAEAAGDPAPTDAA